MHRGAVGVLGLALLLLVSACMGGAARPRGAPITVVPTTFARPTETVLHEGPGQLEGRVLDDEVRPLPEALIEVFRRRADLVFQLRLQTDADGLFVVRGMAAGEYVIYVSKPGYRPHKPEIVFVEDGKTTRADWILPPGPARDPFHATKTFSWNSGYSACPMALGGPAPLACLGASSTYPLIVDEVNNTLLMSLFVEARWPSATSLCPGAVRTDVYSPDQAGGYDTPNAQSLSNPYHWDNLPQSRSPTKVFIPRYGDATAMMSSERTGLNGGANITTHGRWTILSSTQPHPVLGAPLDYSCMIAQTVATALTSFHGNPAPGANWSYFR